MTSQPTHSQPANGVLPRIEALDGLRAISILIVLFGHGAHTTGAPRLLRPMLNMGIVGVDLFFVISGFIITQLLLRERRGGSISLASFWLRRALRILPPFAAACGGLALAATAGLMNWSWPSFFGAVTFTKNTPLFGGDWFFGHFWSLSVEEQFYLLWPLLFMLAAPLTASTQAVSAVLLASPVLAWMCARYWQPLQNVLPFIPYLAVGCLLSLRRWRSRTFPPDSSRRTRLLRLAAVVPLGFGCAYLKGEHRWVALTIPAEAVLLPLCAFMLVDECVRPDGLLKGLLTVAALRWLGAVSYSLYLWQQLFLGPEDAYTGPWFWNRWPQNLLAALASGVLAHLLVERPCVRLKQRWTRSRRPAPGIRPEPLLQDPVRGNL
ncbi:MAG: acyltransferase [Nevskia sp.]|nr:acyltransferase [Nevskia sp.]